MRVSIYQPQYFPRLHYFNRMLSSDVFVIFDSAQYVKSLKHYGVKTTKKRSYQSDAPIMTHQGERLLTVPVKHSGRPPINMAQPQYQFPWQRCHLNALRSEYGKAPFFKKYFPEIQTLIQTRYNSLADLNIATILWGLSRLLQDDYPPDRVSFERAEKILDGRREIRLKKIFRDSTIGVTRPPGRQRGMEWTASICEALGATSYLCGTTALQGYMDEQYYYEKGIDVVMHQWRPAEYQQLYTDRQPFVKNLSIIDLLMNSGPELSLELLSGAEKIAY